MTLRSTNSRKITKARVAQDDAGFQDLVKRLLFVSHLRGAAAFDVD